MADEEQKSQSKSSSGRSRKRRNSRRRRRKKKPKNSENTPNAQSNQNHKQEQPKRKRRRRRRRPRSRNKSKNQQQRNTAVKDPLDARLPEDVFVYTHVVHSSALDTYGFRPDAFMNSTRNLDDFRIDLSAIFPEQESDSEDEVRIYDSALHSPINARLSAEDSGDDQSSHAPRERASDADESDDGQSIEDESEQDDNWLEDVQKAVDDQVDD